MLAQTATLIHISGDDSVSLFLDSQVADEQWSFLVPPKFYGKACLPSVAEWVIIVGDNTNFKYISKWM